MNPLTVAERETLAQTLAVTTAPHLAFAVYQRDAEMIHDLLTGLDRQGLMALAVVLASQAPQPRTRPDDGVVDEIAVQRVMDGDELPLSRPERIAAVHLMADRGNTLSEISKRLHMSGATVRKLLSQEATHTPTEKKDAA